MTGGAAGAGGMAAVPSSADHTGDPTRDRDALLRLAALVTAGAGPDVVFGAVAAEASTGNGGADPTRGSGLVGLLDRVDAADGSLALSSPAGGGTALLVRLPIRSSPR